MPVLLQVDLKHFRISVADNGDGMAKQDLQVATQRPVKLTCRNGCSICLLAAESRLCNVLQVGVSLSLGIC